VTALLSYRRLPHRRGARELQVRLPAARSNRGRADLFASLHQRSVILHHKPHLLPRILLRQVDARKWAASRLAPRKYGDRVEHDVKGVSFQPSVLVQVGSVERPTEIKTISQDGEVIEAE
jgi:hypothetical protein